MTNSYKTSHFWKISILNPVSNEVIEENLFNTINEVFNKYSNIKLNTWRNICMGRSKVYKNFIKVEKVNKNELIQEQENNDEGYADNSINEPQQILISFD